MDQYIYAPPPPPPPPSNQGSSSSNNGGNRKRSSTNNNVGNKRNNQKNRGRNDNPGDANMNNMNSMNSMNNMNNMNNVGNQNPLNMQMMVGLEQMQQLQQMQYQLQQQALGNSGMPGMNVMNNMNARPNFASIHGMPAMAGIPGLVAPQPRSYEGFPGSPSQPPSRRNKNKAKDVKGRAPPAKKQKVNQNDRHSDLPGSSRNTQDHGNGKSSSESEDEMDEEAAAAAAAQSGKRTIVVPGTAITLNTREEIDRWIAERRKKWPTDARVEKRKRILERVRGEKQGANPRKPENASTMSNESAGSVPESTAKRVCKYFTRSGRCSHGTRCNFAHITGSGGNRGSNNSNSSNSRAGESASHTKVYKRFEVQPQLPLYLRMMRSDMEKENEDILNLIEYMYEHNKI